MNEVIPSIIPNDINKYVTNHYADNKGVHIHYASIGEGPLIVMIHGFPDFWYTWRNQMVALAPFFKVVALDLRGYNLSDKPLSLLDGSPGRRRPGSNQPHRKEQSNHSR